MDLVDALTNHIQEIKSIEIVPGYLLPDNQKCCLVDGVLGIEQKFLIVTYMAMCPLTPKEFNPTQSLLAMLATTENIAAVNARKRQCLAKKIDIADELHINSVLLRSHLFKHCKSSILWHHRQWLFETFDLNLSLDTEWSIVALAAQHHPKNYYAWGYLRWCYSQCQADSAAVDRLAHNVAELCEHNLSDASMWAFLHWLRNPELERLAIELDTMFPGHEAILASTKTR